MTTVRTMIGALALAAPLATAHAGGFAISEQSITAAGTGGAGAARADEPGAAWTNPAALADGGGWRIGAALVFARPAIEATGEDAMGPWTSQTEAAWATPPHLDVAWSDGKLAAGVALGVPFGGGVTWPVDWQGRFEIVASRIEVFRAAPFVAWDLGRVRVAAGPHVDRARMRIGRQLDFIDMEGDVAIDMDGTGFGGHAAVWAQASRDVAVGLTYKSRTKIPLEGGADFTTPDAFAGKTPDQVARGTLRTPDRFALGGRWARGRWAVLADVELTLWGVHREVAIDFSQEQTPDVHQPTRWSSTFALRAGGEAQVSRRVTARAGAAWDPSPAPDDTLAPSSPDANRTSITGGVSVAASDAVMVDGFAEYLHLASRATGGVETMSASYGGHAAFVGVGVRWQR